MIDAALTLTIGEETLLLHPERAVIWLRQRTVIIADTHFGKSALFRHHGLAVPAGSDDFDRTRLSRLLAECEALRLIVLGDFLHAPLAAESRDALELARWCEGLGGTEVWVVAGNHDRGVQGLWQPPVRWHEGSLIEAPFCFTHDAARAEPAASQLFTLSGHIHPVVRLRGLRKRAPRVPIFWQREGGLVLPSFGIFTGGYVVTPQDGDRVFAVGPQRVVRFR